MKAERAVSVSFSFLVVVDDDDDDLKARKRSEPNKRQNERRDVSSFFYTFQGPFCPLRRSLNISLFLLCP